MGSHQPREFLQGHLVKKFETLQHILVPRSQKFTVKQQKESIQLINLMLQEKPLMIHLKIAAFFYLIDFYSFLVAGRSFQNLAHSNKQRVLDVFFDSPIPLLRKGFWGINTLAKLGVYGQASVYPEIGYMKREL